jgi:hypothetical protein
MGKKNLDTSRSISLYIPPAILLLIYQLVAADHALIVQIAVSSLLIQFAPASRSICHGRLRQRDRRHGHGGSAQIQLSLRVAAVERVVVVLAATASSYSSSRRPGGGGQRGADRRPEPVRGVQDPPAPLRRRLRAGSLLPADGARQVHHSAPRLRRQQHHQAPPGVCARVWFRFLPSALDRSARPAGNNVCGGIDMHGTRARTLTDVVYTHATLQDLPESSRADAVSSMVYEAEARLRDPVYGCAGAVCRLQRQANELKVQLARAQADLLSAQAQHADLLALFCVEMANRRGNRQQQQQPSPPTTTVDGGGGSEFGGAAYGQTFYDSDDLDSATWPDHEAQLWT